ncbi:MAG: metallophosphoesterase [Nanoarchaeota archaeon]|nr:metallophosphoesterase [Nanoarchaeota archaeon]MCG2717452.1 metallophosphoesterase [Nanoarchaeota archaeon]
MEISKNLEIMDLCLYFKKEKTLVISDIHMGYEEALNKKGILAPRFQYAETLNRLKTILTGFKLQKIVINGDLKHEFGTISETEWRHTLGIIDFLFQYCKKIILIRGNHDKILGPIAKKRSLEVRRNYIIGKTTMILHGDKIPTGKTFDKMKRLVIGHEHPAISLYKDGRLEKFKCFLKGKWKKKELIVIPSYNVVTEGTDMLKDKLLSPFLKKNIDDFKVFIVSDGIYGFGTIKDIKML